MEDIKVRNLSLVGFLLLSLAIFVNCYEFLFKNEYLDVTAGYFDEIAMLLLFSLLLSKGRLISSELWIIAWIPVFVFFLFMSFIVGFYSFSEFRFYENLIQGIINLKLFIFFSIFYFVSKMPGGNSFIRKLYYVVLMMSCVGVFFNLIFPDVFQYSTYEYALERERIIGFQFKPNDLALCFAFFSMPLFFSNIVEKPLIRFVLIFFVFAVIVYSTSRTALSVFMLNFLFFMITKKKYNYMLGLAFALTLLVVYYWEAVINSFFITETISNFSEINSFESSQYIRAIMVKLGFDIMLDYFPIGYGSGTFGTVLSFDSPVYQILGVSNLYFFQSMEGVYDSNVASVLGEYGFIGVVVYCYLSSKVAAFFASGSRAIYLLLLITFFVVSFSQPFFNYQVNSLNILLALYVTFRMRKGVHE